MLFAELSSIRQPESRSLAGPRSAVQHVRPSRESLPNAARTAGHVVRNALVTLRLKRARPAVTHTATVLLSPSALRRPQGSIALSALSSRGLSSALFGGDTIGPTVPDRLLAHSPPPERCAAALLLLGLRSPTRADVFHFTQASVC